jgi:isoleucyl-tRNA synthetase
MFDVRTFVAEDMDGEEFSEGTVYIDDEMTEELLDEAFVSEVIRAIQQKRKEAELEVEDKVDLGLKGDIEPVKNYETDLKSRMKLAGLVYGESDFKYSGTVEFEGRKLEFSFSEPVD